MPDHGVGGVQVPGRDGVLRISWRDGAIAAIEPDSGAAQWVALPGLVNLHAHADRSFALRDASRPASLQDALRAAAIGRAAFTTDDVRTRATRFFERSVAHGVTRVRTHTDVDPIVDVRSMEGVLAAKRDVAGRLTVDVIAFSTSRNDLAEPGAADRLQAAVAMGADFIGVSLNSSADPALAFGRALDLAERSGLPIDLHLDEHLEPARALTGMVVDAVLERGLNGRITISHGCALAALDEAGDLIDRIARAGITVIALPESNLFLQDRGGGTPRRRGITLVHELAAAGVPVRLGTDNVRDWFYPFGDGDMLDTALMASVALHLDDPALLIAALCDGRSEIRPGDPADLVLVPASSLDDALARRPSGRLVYRAGRQVAGPAL
jgi:cytosine deaminase